MAVAVTPITLPKKPLPAGWPRERYENHNRKLKAMRIAIALLDTGIYTSRQAGDRTIRAMADRIGVHPPSRTTCRMVRSLLPPPPPSPARRPARPSPRVSHP